MKGIQALRERRTEISRAANQLLADQGDRVWSKADQEKYDAFIDEIERVAAQISAHQRKLDDEAQEAIPVRNRDAEAAESEAKKKARACLELVLRNMTRDITPEQWAQIQNTMSTTTGSQGGYTVPSLIATDLVDAMKDYGGMRRVADRLVTSAGNDLAYPTSDGTSELGEIVAQNASAAAADPVFGTVPLNCVKFGSKKIAVPIELLQDTNIDIIAFIQKRIRARIGRIQNLKFTQGSGTGEPFGLVTAASVGKTGTTGQTLTIIYDDLVDMADSVDVGYLDGDSPLSWMFGQTLRRVVRKIKDTQGRPIWTPSYEGGATVATPDLLLGYPVNINNDMPVPGANNKSLSFGQHKRYMVRDAMEIQLFRFEDSAFISNGQVGFLAWARAGGNLLDTAAVKLYQHSAT